MPLADDFNRKEGDFIMAELTLFSLGFLMGIGAITSIFTVIGK